jgi:hypothetical protein
MLLSAMRQHQTSIDTKSSQQFPEGELPLSHRVFFSPHRQSLRPVDVGHRTGRRELGGVNEG